MSFFKTNFHFIHFPPLLSITICFIAGITMHNNLLLLCILFTLIISCMCCAYVKQNNAYKQLILYFFAIISGAYLHHKEWHDYHYFYTVTDNKKIAVTGTIIDIHQTTINHQKTTAILCAVTI
jgi:hypothetical protein